jgi:hypothetical protein
MVVFGKIGAGDSQQYGSSTSHVKLVMRMVETRRFILWAISIPPMEKQNEIDCTASLRRARRMQP